MAKEPLPEKSILDRFRLEGKTALITGGAQGIGRAYAHALGEAGANIVIADLNLPGAEETAAELTKKGIRTMAIKADVTQEADVEKMVKAAAGAFGGLHIGVNNAGIGVWEDAETQSKDTWDRVLSLNLDGVYLCCKHECLAMQQSGYGKIINTASMSGHIVNTPQNQCAYNTSKAGVIHLTRSLAVEWAQKGIRVNSISPGYTETSLLVDLAETETGITMVPFWQERIPLTRFAQVGDLQGAIVYLASEASDYMTGHDMVIDGGYCCW